MKTFFILTIVFLVINQFNKYCYGNNYTYILNENTIEETYQKARKEINSTEILILKEARGILLRFKLDNPLEEYYELSNKTILNLKKIEIFLAKNKNPAIIEVHTGKKSIHSYLKNWELATVISNKIEYCLKTNNILKYKNNISSVGYGEFLPANNTPNNGGEYINRVDIIVLCSISGE